jgi:putative YjhG/YagF family dehydratase
MGSSGGSCQFLGTAATSQVVAEALGMALPHSALSPSGESIWFDMAHRSALALLRLAANQISLSRVLTPQAVENAMLVHAACGGSTNLLLHIPAIAHAAGLSQPRVEDWIQINHLTPRLVDVLPNGPRNHPTVQVYMAGGVPEVMLHLRKMGLLNLDVMTVSGEKLSAVLDWWEGSQRRQAVKERLQQTVGVDPDQVIMGPDEARKSGLGSTLVFPVGNLAPAGSVIKATAIDPGEISDDNIYHLRGPARVFTNEKDAIAAVKGQSDHPVNPGEIIVLIGGGPSGTGMEETYQLTAALKHLPWGKKVALLTDARFSGVSTGACIGHIGPEALAGGPIGKIQEGDVIEIRINRVNLTGEINLVATAEGPLTEDQAAALLQSRDPHPRLTAHSALPDDTRLWAALQSASGGTWNGCIFDTDRIIKVIEAGINAIDGTDN